jgi:hypothetical protein
MKDAVFDYNISDTKDINPMKKAQNAIVGPFSFKAYGRIFL